MRMMVLAAALAMASSLALPASAQKRATPPMSANSAMITPVAAPVACPVLSFSVKNRTNSAKVNVLFQLTNLGPGPASNMKVTGITCTDGFVYSPMPGLLALPFTIPTVPTLGAGASVGGFNGFFSRTAGPLGAAFSCTIASTNGPNNGCAGGKVVLIP